MKLTAVYEGADGDVSVEVSTDDAGLTVSGFDSSQAADAQVITLSYGGKSVTYTITVKETAHVHAMIRVEAKEADCTEDGNIEYYICAGCGKYFADEAGEHEMDPADVVIKAAGHIWDEGRVTKEPTETEEGIRTYTCTVCGGTRTETIDRLSPSEDPSQGGGADVNTPGNGSQTGSNGSAGNGADGNSAASAETGDENMAMGWVIVLIAAAGACSGIMIYRRRKTQA